MMNILVINCGSSSIKAAVLNGQNGTVLLSMKVQRILDQPQIYLDGQPIDCPKAGHEAVLNIALPLIKEKNGDYAYSWRRTSSGARRRPI
jgi:acetate kinase